MGHQHWNPDTSTDLLEAVDHHTVMREPDAILLRITNKSDVVRLDGEGKFYLHEVNDRS